MKVVILAPDVPVYLLPDALLTLNLLPLCPLGHRFPGRVLAPDEHGHEERPDHTATSARACIGRRCRRGFRAASPQMASRSPRSMWPMTAARILASLGRHRSSAGVPDAPRLAGPPAPRPAVQLDVVTSPGLAPGPSAQQPRAVREPTSGPAPRPRPRRAAARRRVPARSGGSWQRLTQPCESRKFLTPAALRG
jgi:hypothetical protein